MDLLSEEKTEQKPSKKKIVLVMLIVSIILLIFLLIIISALQDSQPKKETLAINGSNIEITNDLIVSDDSGNKYISLKGLIDKIEDYKYYYGSIFEITENKNKGYIQNEEYIVGFEADSNKIYKTIENSAIECQYYELENKILQYNENLYMNLEDLQQVCNLVVTIENNQIKINSPNSLITTWQKEFEEKGKNIQIDILASNQKAISYNMLVVSTNEKYGVLNALNTEETIISSKYDSLKFDEYTQTFIVSNDNKYGVISKKGKGIIDLKYDNITIINYEPLLYDVTQNNKHGVLNKEGKIVVQLGFDNFGSKNIASDTTSNSILILKKIDSGDDGIVVLDNEKYGVANLSNGKMFLECELDNIYSKLSDSNELINYVQFNGKEYTLEAYIKYANTITVVNTPETKNTQNNNTETETQNTQNNNENQNTEE